MTTISCAPPSDAFRCPTKWDLFDQLRHLLPRGRAWQTHDVAQAYRTGDDTSQFGSYQIGHTGLGEETIVPALTVLEQFWAAFAEVLGTFYERACALTNEMFCATVSETLPEWAEEWGFPDPCLPYTALCEKTIAVGGSTCAYFVEVAAARGWVVTCSSAHAEMTVTVDLDASPAYQPPSSLNRAGSMISGCNDCADAGSALLVCLIERIKPAHVKAIYETVGGE